MRCTKEEKKKEYTPLDDCTASKGILAPTIRSFFAMGRFHDCNPRSRQRQQNDFKHRFDTGWPACARAMSKGRAAEQIWTCFCPGVVVARA